MPSARCPADATSCNRRRWKQCTDVRAMVDCCAECRCRRMGLRRHTSAISSARTEASAAATRCRGCVGPTTPAATAVTAARATRAQLPTSTLPASQCCVPRSEAVISEGAVCTNEQAAVELMELRDAGASGGAHRRGCQHVGDHPKRMISPADMQASRCIAQPMSIVAQPTQNWVRYLFHSSDAMEVLHPKGMHACSICLEPELEGHLASLRNTRRNGLQKARVASPRQEHGRSRLAHTHTHKIDCHDVL